MKILVTGGAGYIGGFMVRKLLERGDQVVILDNLSRGNENVLDTRAVFVKGDVGDRICIASVFSQHQIEAIIHFAGFIAMEESMKNPYLYLQNNAFQTLNLLEEAMQHNVKKFIFSSSAGVYGNPQKVPIPEDHPTRPTNPYGESKIMVEQMLWWFQKIYGLRFAALRYFNASGAALDGSFGEQHKPESHIIPLAVQAAINGKSFNLFGTDYDTPDGTCVRDYIHVLDLVEAHVLALNKLENDFGGFVYNVGTGNGYSNKQVVEMIRTVSKKGLPIKELPRRLGDANALIADVSKITSELHFNPKYSDLKTIIESAWKWHAK